MRRDGFLSSCTHGLAARIVAWMLVPAQVLLAVPTSAAPPSEVLSAASSNPTAEAADETTSAPTPAQVDVNRTRPQVQRPPLYPVFSRVASDEEIFRARVFGEPLNPVGGSGTAPENQALSAAIMTYLKTGDPELTEPLEAFLRSYPQSVWRASLLANLGMVYERTGHFGRAERALEEAWGVAKEASDRVGRVVADQALGELLDLRMQFGHVDGLEAVLEEVGEREVLGGAMERVRDARASAWGLRNQHEKALPSGPIALERLLIKIRPGERRHEAIQDFHATPEGASLQEMEALSATVGLDLEMAQREPQADVVIPSVIHLKAGHFAALVREEGGRYLLDDPLLGGEVWLSRSALEEEASGYFLIPRGVLRAGWKKADPSSAENIRGKCIFPVPGQPYIKPCNLTSGGGTAPCYEVNSKCPRMADYSFHTLRTSLHITDTPVGYSPPRGPEVEFGVFYNHREAYQPQTFYFSNLGAKWTFDWLSYLEDDPANPNATTDLYYRGGGRESYSGFVNGTSAPEQESQAIVVRTSSNPIRYERRLPDGSVEVFDVPDGASSYPRRVFMTQARDPQGNAISFSYDSQLRLVSVTDAIGQVSTLSYDLTSDPLKITKVTDPFGRSASFEYDPDGHLIRITDVIGIKSEFSYGSLDFINALTTPYGTTQFSWGNAPNVTDFWLQAIDPLGGTERINYVAGTSAIPNTEPAAVVPTGFTSHNLNIASWNTFYWDKRAWMLYPGDFTKAKINRWTFSANMKLGDFPHSEKLPLENRVWHDYLGGIGYDWVGPLAKPAKIARVLDDGTSQIRRYEYNSKGLKTRVTDPLGRETVYEYDTNEIDLLRIKQKNGGSYDLLEQSTYNTKHEPLTVTDAAGQVTTYTYNTAGQVLTVVTPPRAGLSQAQRTTTYAYDTNGYLQSITGPLAGATTSYTYDGYGRIRTITDSDSYTLTYDYDALDRITKVTYPDGTYEQTVYNRLDAERQRDRLGRWTQTFYDALRRPVAVSDSLNQTATLQWCTCGSLEKVVDPNGNATTWERDVQGRVTRVVRANGSDGVVTYENTTSRLKEFRDPKQQVTAIQYFLDDTWKQVAYSSSQPTITVSFTYDPAYNRLVTMTDAAGTTTYTYHPVGAPSLGAARLASADGPLSNDVITYSYDELGRVVGRAINGVSLSWSYDALGRISGETNALGSFGYSYDGVTDRLLSLAYPNGQTTTLAYFGNTQDHRLQEIHNKLSGGATLSRFQYTHDANGTIKSWTQQADSNPAKVYDLGYDAVNQLVTATLRTTDPTPVILKRYRYSYDKAENRTTEQIDDANTAASYNVLNALTGSQPGGALRFAGSVNEVATVTVQGSPAQVTAGNVFEGSATVSSGTNNVAVAATDPSGNVRTNTYQVNVSGSAKTLTYDANGNLTGDGTRAFEWNAVNRLTAVVQGTLRSEFTYDGWGHRVRIIEKDNGVVTSDRRFLWCGLSICEERDATGAVVTRRFFGQGVQEGGTAFFFATDHLGSVRELTDSTGTIRARYEYDPYGRVTKISGDKDSPYGFTGHFSHVPSGLALAPLRAYDSSFGRWINQDPIGGASGLNLYGYVHGRPVDMGDPLGLFVWAPAAAFVAQSSAAGGALGPGGMLAGALIAGTILTITIYWPTDQSDPPEDPQGGGNASGGSTSGSGSGTTTTTTTTTTHPPDPVKLEPYNAGRDCNGKCNPCKPPPPPWSAPGNKHGSTSGTHWHWIEWHQDPVTCICYPKRMSGPKPPNL